MIKKRFFLVLLTIIFSNTVFSQVEISGQVKDKNSKKPLSFCTVKTLNSQDSVLRAVSTDNKGFFTTNTRHGDYTILIECIGYKADSLHVQAGNDDIFMGTILLEVADHDIEEVVVQTATTNNMLDKDVITVTNKLKQGSANTRDVLSKVKGVQLDRYSNTLKVDNDANILILVDGLKKNQDYIKNLAPDRLQKVEIIRDPGGRYGLEGYSAIINVILKSDYTGYEIYVDNNSLIDTDEPGNILAVFSNGVEINYTIDKLNIYGAMDYNKNSFNVTSTMLQEFTSGLSIEKTPTDDKRNSIIRQNEDEYYFGIDYKVNPKHTLSMETSFGGFLSDNKMKNDSRSIYRQDNIIYKNLNLHSTSDSKSKFFDYDLFYIGKLNSKLELEIDFYHYFKKEKFNNFFSVDDSDNRTEKGTNSENKMEFYSEFNYQLSPKSALQFGYGYNNINKKTNSTVQSAGTPLPGTDNPNNDFKYSDMRNKLYSYFSHNFNDKIGGKIGLAAELSTFKALEQTENFVSYQPFFNLKYQPFSFLNIRLKYRSRTNYPTLSQTNPTEYTIDNESVTKGNPNLLPAVKHRISTRFTILNGLASLEPYYKFSQNYIAQITSLRADGLMEYSYDNAGKYSKQGLKADLTIPLAKFLIVQSNANIYNEKIKYNNIDNSLNDWDFSSQLIYFNEKLNTVAGLFYQKNNTKRITAQGYSSNDVDLWGLFIQQSFLKERLNIMLGYMLPISFGTNNKQIAYLQTNQYTQEKIEDASFLQNMIILNLSFRLQKGITRNKQERNKETTESKKGFINF